MQRFECHNSIRLTSCGEDREMTAESDQKWLEITYSPCHLYKKCVVHTLSSYPASLSPVFTFNPLHTHLSPLCNTATSCLGALGVPACKKEGIKKARVGLIEIKRVREGKGRHVRKWEKEFSELTQPWSKSRLPNPPDSAVSLFLSISSCWQEVGENTCG